MTKKPTAQGISALLSKAGIERSQSRPTRIRGYREHSEGFKITKGYEDGEVEVEYRPSSFRARDTTSAQVNEVLDKYAEVIVAAGFAVVKSDRGLLERLIVTASDAEEV